LVLLRHEASDRIAACDLSPVANANTRLNFTLAGVIGGLGLILIIHSG